MEKLRSALLRRKQELANAGFQQSANAGQRGGSWDQLVIVDALLSQFPEGSIPPSFLPQQAIATPAGTFNPFEAASSLGLNPAKLGFTAAGVLLGASVVAGTVALVKRKKRKTSKRKTSKRKTSKRKSRLKFGSPAWRKKYARKGKRKRVGTQAQYARPGGKKVHKTKTGQPYILLSNGKARFIKRSGSRRRS